jgi:hypothetical protein
MGICLTRDEIAELARTTLKRKQVEFLRANGIRHYLDGHGWPVVTRAAVEGEHERVQAIRTWKSNKAA